MNPVEQAIKYGRLLSRYLRDELTPFERQELEDWLAADEKNREMLEQFSQQPLPEQLKQFQQYNAEAAWEQLSKRAAQPARIVPVYRRWWWAAAALVLLATGAGVYLTNRTSPTLGHAEASNQPAKIPIMPGGEKAILTLGDGSTIVLNNAKNGELASQGNTKILKLTDGRLAYEKGRDRSTMVAFNAIQTPRGGQYRITLPDGTNVWLNAASSLRYPTAFSGKERSVEMTGEAYFEVAKDSSRPFRVLVNAAGKAPATIEVLGTHFNVNAYRDEANIKATLLEGSVKLTKGAAANILQPGQQAGISEAGSIAITNSVDLDQVVAWKNGYFIFNSQDVPSIMRQISRWFDVEVSYRGTISEETFSGMVSRQSNIAQVLKIMEMGGIKFQIDGRKIVVLK